MRQREVYGLTRMGICIQPGASFLTLGLNWDIGNGHWASIMNRFYGAGKGIWWRAAFGQMGKPFR
jgi:hypothetical protein